MKHLCSSRWADYVKLEANDRSGGILIMRDKRTWKGELINNVLHSITCKLTSVHDNFEWCSTGIYRPNCRRDRQELWLEMAANRGAWEGP